MLLNYLTFLYHLKKKKLKIQLIKSRFKKIYFL